MNSIIAFFMSIIAAVSSFFTTYSFTVDASQLGEKIGNKASNVNVWEMGNQFVSPTKNEENDIFEFVEYIQLMQCSGGNNERDPFINPSDTSTLTDYDFTRLIKNCRGILSLGAKPCLKLGNVPQKFSSETKVEGMTVNVYPPDDWDAYYKYMCDLAQALVDEFGKEELLKWHYCVLTEFENDDWFHTANRNPQESAEAYCKLYDYTVDALMKTIGENVFVGAHAMGVTEGLWDEAIFIRHCGNGINYKTGEKGSRICFLSASYYESNPGNVGKRKTLPETIDYMRDAAESVGLNNLVYGIDEGRILCGTVSGKETDQLLSRTVGYIWQAAFDARIYGQMIEDNIDYFSHWDYFSEGLIHGNPTLSYHVSKHIASFADSKLAKTKATKKGLVSKAEVKTFAAFDEGKKTLNVMTYNFKNDLEYSKTVTSDITINAPQFKGDKVTVTEYLINDDCNYFDDWLKDREKYNITDECSSWSPQCPYIIGMLNDSRAKEIYWQNNEKYAECSKLEPKTYEVPVVDGEIQIKATLGANNVAFYEITEAAK